MNFFIVAVTAAVLSFAGDRMIVIWCVIIYGLLLYTAGSTP